MNLQREVLESPQTGEISSVEATLSLANTETDLARSLRTNNVFNEADPYARNAVGRLNEIRSGLMGNLEERCLQALGLALLEEARCALKLGDLDRGRKQFMESIKAFEGLVTSFPNKRQYRTNLSVVTAEFGDELLTRWKEPNEAERLYQLSLVQFKHLLNLPALTDLQSRGYALGLYRAGVAALYNGDQTTATSHFVRCLEMRTLRLHQIEDEIDELKKKGAKTDPPPTVLVTARINQMLVQARLGQEKEVLATADWLTKLVNAKDKSLANRPNVVYQMACAYAILVEGLPSEDADKRKQFQTKGMNLLVASLKMGYANMQEVDTSPDLDGLRDIPDFKEQLNKAKPKK
jgi:tetratricopeptide (TPR) repeat protein